MLYKSPDIYYNTCMGHRCQTPVPDMGQGSDTVSQFPLFRYNFA